VRSTRWSGEARCVRLAEAGADQDVLDHSSQLLERGQRPEHRPPPRQRERHAVQLEPGDFLDQVDLARHVAGAPRGNDELVVEAEPVEDLALPLLGDFEPDQCGGAVEAELDPLRLRQRRARGGLPGPPGVRVLDEKLRAEARRVVGEVRVDALLPAVGALRAKVEPGRAAEDPDRLEVRGLEQHRGRLLGDLAVLAAHDRPDRDGAVGVGDHQLVRRQLALLPVESADPLAGTGVAHYDPPLVQPGLVEGVERAAEREHRVVGRVDDVGDRAHPGGRQPRAEPRGRRPDADVAEEPADVHRAGVGLLDRDRDRLVAGALGLHAGRRSKLAAGECGDLARETVDREQVGPVAGHLDLEHVLDQREHVGQRRPRLEGVLEHHDPRVVGPQLELALGEDHPGGELAAELRLAEHGPAGEDGAR
jgi:hypothetical protein